MNKLPFVSIILPCYNEEEFIEATINSIFNSSYPSEKIEILIIDGMSTDNSMKIINELTHNHDNIRFFKNKKQLLAPALNIGLRNGRGEIFVRLDAHSKMNKDYISNCVKLLQDDVADVVGGILINEPYDNSILSKTIALALTSPFGVGNASHRIGIKGKTQYVDSVPFGSFSKKLIDEIGHYNEKCNRSEDIEFYHRVKATGRKIIISSEIIVSYICNNAMNMIKRYFRNGVDVTQYYFRDDIIAFRPRHLIPFFFFCGILLALMMYIIFSNYLLFLFILIPYLILGIIFSFIMAFKEHDFRLALIAPLVFFTLHIAHGLGAFIGVFIGKFSSSRY